MKPYNPSAKCEKCGSADSSTAWHSPDTFRNLICADIKDEHMLRHCSNCGYEWLEAPMDTAQEPVTYPHGYAFGRYRMQGGKGGPKELTSILVGFRDITDEQAVEFAAKIEEMLAAAGFKPVNGTPKYMTEKEEHRGLSCGHTWPTYLGYRCPKCGDNAAEKIAKSEIAIEELP